MTLSAALITRCSNFLSARVVLPYYTVMAFVRQNEFLSVCDKVQNPVACWYFEVCQLRSELHRPDCIEGGTAIQEQEPCICIEIFQVL